MALLFQLVKSQKALNAPEALQRLYVKESDERCRLIAEKSGTFGFNLLLGLLALATAVSSWFNPTVAFTLFATMAAAGILRAALRIYYSKIY